MDYDHKLGNKLGNNKQMIFGCLKKNAGISLSQFSKIVGISQTAIENNIAKLKKAGARRRQNMF